MSGSPGRGGAQPSNAKLGDAGFDDVSSERLWLQPGWRVRNPGLVRHDKLFPILSWYSIGAPCLHSYINVKVMSLQQPLPALHTNSQLGMNYHEGFSAENNWHLTRSKSSLYPWHKTRHEHLMYNCNLLTQNATVKRSSIWTEPSSPLKAKIITVHI